jgi:hypothetical protein
MPVQNWEIRARRAKDVLLNSVPKQWILPAHRLPSAHQKNVEDFPRKSGVLSDREVSITEMSATALVAGMGAGLLSAEEVVTAFLKRAVLGHQLVCCAQAKATFEPASGFADSDSSTLLQSSWRREPFLGLKSSTNTLSGLESLLGPW